MATEVNIFVSVGWKGGGEAELWGGEWSCGVGRSCGEVGWRASRVAREWERGSEREMGAATTPHDSFITSTTITITTCFGDCLFYRAKHLQKREDVSANFCGG